MYVDGKARRQWQRAFFMFVQTHKKAALPIIKVDAAFLLLSSETVSRFPLCKYKVYLLNTQEFVITFYCKFATFCFKIDTVCGFTLLLYQQSIDSDT